MTTYAPPAAPATPARRGATLRRRLLSLAPRLGLHVTDVGPGTVVLSRRRGLRITPVDRDTVVVARRGTLRPHAADAVDGLLLTAAKDLDVVDLGPGAALVTSPAVLRKHRLEHEKAVHAHLLPLHLAGVLATYRVDVVLDVGANRGQYGRLLRRAGYRGHIVSFEPVPGVFEELQAVAARDGNWSAYQVALARTDGTTAMQVVPGTLSSLLPATEFGATRYAKLREPTEVQVPMRRLDGMLDEILPALPGSAGDRRLYLKLDTQGFDLEAFAGLGDRVGDVVGMQSEMALMSIYEGMPRLPEALAAYEGAGFEVTGFYPVSREKRTARVLEFDCVMVRPSAR